MDRSLLLVLAAVVPSSATSSWMERCFIGKSVRGAIDVVSGEGGSLIIEAAPAAEVGGVDMAACLSFVQCMQKTAIASQQHHLKCTAARGHAAAQRASRLSRSSRRYRYNTYCNLQPCRTREWHPREATFAAQILSGKLLKASQDFALRMKIRSGLKCSQKRGRTIS